MKESKMITQQNNLVIENSEGKLTVTAKEDTLSLEITKDILNIPYSMDFNVSTEDAKELIKLLLVYLGED